MSPVIHPKAYDVIVIGAGHAGIEAALASARMNCRTLLLTMNVDTVGFMSCNPAVGGPAKSQLVREVDALGGQIGVSTDLTFLQMKTLNTAKGPAVWALRAQSDREQYHCVMKKIIEDQEGLDLKQAMVEEILFDDSGNVTGVKTGLDLIYEGKTVVVTTGTFLKGLVHVGLKHTEAGRMGELPAKGLSDSLKKAGLELGRSLNLDIHRVFGGEVARKVSNKQFDAEVVAHRVVERQVQIVLVVEHGDQTEVGVE